MNIPYSVFSTILCLVYCEQVLSSSVTNNQPFRNNHPIILSTTATEQEFKEDEITSIPPQMLIIMATIPPAFISILDAKTTDEQVSTTNSESPIEVTTSSPLEVITSVVTSISKITSIMPITETSPKMNDMMPMDQITTSTMELAPTSTFPPIPATTTDTPNELTSLENSSTATTSQVITERVTNRTMINSISTTIMPMLSTVKNQPRIRLTISRPSTPRTISPISKPAVQHSGKCTDNGEVFADPTSCYTFYSCYRKKAHKMYCGGRTVFNPSTNQCDWPQNVPICNFVSG